MHMSFNEVLAARNVAEFVISKGATAEIAAKAGELAAARVRLIAAAVASLGKAKPAGKIEISKGRPPEIPRESPLVALAKKAAAEMTGGGSDDIYKIGPLDHPLIKAAKRQAAEMMAETDTNESPLIKAARRTQRQLEEIKP